MEKYTVKKSQETTRKFISEIDENGSLSFLDIKVSCENNKFVVSVLRKPTFRCIFTNFEGFTRDMHKHEFTETLPPRSSRLCSNYENFRREVETFKSIFKHNNYLQNVVNHNIKVGLSPSK